MPFSGSNQRFFFSLAYPKVVGMLRIGWSACSVLGGRHTPNWVVAMLRFMHLDALEERFKKVNEVNLVMDMTGFEFYGDFEAFKKDFKLCFGEYKRVRRVALGGEQKWLEWFTRLMGSFTPTEEKHFPEGQFQAAVDWATE